MQQVFWFRTIIRPSMTAAEPCGVRAPLASQTQLYKGMCTSKPSEEKALRMQPKALTQQPETIASTIFAATAKHTPSVAYLEHKCVRLTKPAVPKTETLQNLLWRRLPLSPDTASDANPSRSSENVVNLRCNPLACIGLSGIREAVTIRYKTVSRLHK